MLVFEISSMTEAGFSTNVIEVDDYDLFSPNNI